MGSASSALTSRKLPSDKATAEQRRVSSQRPSTRAPATDEAYYSLFRLRGGEGRGDAGEAYYSLFRLRGGDDRDDAARLASSEAELAAPERAYKQIAMLSRRKAHDTTHELTSDSDASYVLIRLAAER